MYIWADMVMQSQSSCLMLIAGGRYLFHIIGVSFQKYKRKCGLQKDLNGFAGIRTNLSSVLICGCYLPSNCGLCAVIFKLDLSCHRIGPGRYQTGRLTEYYTLPVSIAHSETE